MFANQLAKAVGIKSSVIRYYTRIGLLHPDRNPDNGYRQYAPADVERVRIIRKAKWLGFTLGDVKPSWSEPMLVSLRARRFAASF